MSWEGHKYSVSHVTHVCEKRIARCEEVANAGGSWRAPKIRTPHLCGVQRLRVNRYRTTKVLLRNSQAIAAHVHSYIFYLPRCMKTGPENWGQNRRPGTDAGRSPSLRKTRWPGAEKHKNAGNHPDFRCLLSGFKPTFCTIQSAFKPTFSPRELFFARSSAFKPTLRLLAWRRAGLLGGVRTFRWWR